MATQKRKKRKTTGKKRKSNSLVIWSIIIISLLVIGYFTYPQLKPWFIEKVNSKEVKSGERVTTTAPASLTANVWVNEMDGSMLGFKKDGSYSIDFPSVDQSRQITGTYNVQGDNIRLKYNKNTAICAGEEGSYHFSINNDQLKFEAIKESCKERKDLLLDGWFKL